LSAPWEIRYARASDGTDVAYATYGDGPRDILLIHGFPTHLGFVGDSPWHSYWTRRLGERFRVIQLDKQGTGLSDRTLGHGSIEVRMRHLGPLHGHRLNAAGDTDKWSRWPMVRRQGQAYVQDMPTTTLRLDHAELCGRCADLLPVGTTVSVYPRRDVTCLGCADELQPALRLVRTDPWAMVDDAALRSRLQARRLAPARQLAISA
jgi:hypothetical protein